MRLLSAIHRWAGAFIGLLLALLGLSGAILVWEGEWVTLPGASDPLAENAAQIAAITERAASSGDLSRITFASDEIGLHQLVFADGGGAYVRQDGTTVDRWADMWGRPELWLFDLHHYLFSGYVGEWVTGILGLAGVAFVITGLILWWRSRRTFAPTLLPKRFAPGPIVKHHRDLGVVTAPLLLLSMLTGSMMLFPAVSDALVGAEQRPAAEYRLAQPVGPAGALIHAKVMFPDAALRRISLPAEPGGSIAVRMRQPFEWTPNGRTQLTFAADGTVSVEDAAIANTSATVSEKFYPLHSAKVGGFAMKLLMTVSGLSLALLGALTTWSFWNRRSAARSRRRKQSTRAAAPQASSALS